jgi:hypothetical protein
MMNDAMQKTIEFIIDQQAQSTAKIAVLADAQNRAEKRWEQTEESIRALLAIAELHEREIATHEREIAIVSAITRETDERLNNLIDVVERYISEHRDGKA